MNRIDDPAELTEGERTHELARILAAGVLRLRQRRSRVGEPAETSGKVSTKSSAGRLEVSGDSRLSVTSG